MAASGTQLFAAAVTRFAGTDPAVGPALRTRVEEIATDVDAPLRVGVVGRTGSGRRTVGRALACAGLAVVDPGPAAELTVRVLVEVPKPEDLAALRSRCRPDLLVLNKADLTGLRPGGPVETAVRRCRRLAARTGVPVEPMVALAAVAALSPGVVDDTAVAALRVLTEHPADLGSPDAFLAGEHRLSAGLRARLLAQLDLFGIAHAVVTLRAHPDAGPGGVRRALRAAGRIDQVLAALRLAGAVPRYRRIAAAVTELRSAALADPDLGDALAGFLAGPDVLAARAAAAAEVLRVAGVPVPDPARRSAWSAALEWQRYRRGPVGELHRCCAEDLVRDALGRLSAGAP